MSRIRRSTLAAAFGCCVLLGACGADAAPAPAAPTAPPAPTVTVQAAPPSQPAPPADAPPSQPPNPANPAGEAPTTPPEEANPAAARAVIVDFYAAINEGDYRRAYLHWANGGAASQQSFEQFRDGFAATASVEAVVGEPFDANAGAGSAYVSVPISLTATQTDGSVQLYEGAYVLRRVNDVPGSTAEQRRWHIDRAEIR